MEPRYFNNAGAGLMSEKTLETIIDHMKLEMKIGAYKAAIINDDRINEFYVLSSRLLNTASKDEIAFIDSASRGWNLVIYGLNITKDDIIVTFESEYGTNLLTIYDIAKRTGCLVKIVKCNSDGSVNINAVNDALANGGTILAISHVAAQGSIVNPVVELGKIAKKYNAIYIVDGCQAVGQMKVDVQEINCHAYITAGRKWLCGPRGTGILYVRAESPIRTPQIDLASADLIFDNYSNVVNISIRKDAKQFELWEKNMASVLGLTNAIKEYINYGIDGVANSIISKANRIRDCICSNSNLVLVGAKTADVGIVGFYMFDHNQENKTKDLFEKKGFIISCMCDWDCPLFFPQNGVHYIFRVTPHYYTSDEDVNALCDLIKSL